MIEEEPNLTVHKQPSTLVNYIIFNSYDGHLFANEDLREAAASVIDGRVQRVATTEIIKNQLAEIGLNADIQQYDFGTAINTC